MSYTQEQREQAARVLEQELEHKKWTWANVYAADLQEQTKPIIDALDIAIACLRSPGASPDVDGKAGGWVRTSERVPTEADADDDGYVPCLLKGMFTGRTIRIALKYQVVTADTVMFFLPLPALPEVDNG